MPPIIISSDKEERAGQLERLGHELYLFYAAGEPQQAFDLIKQWDKALSKVAPHDEISRLELALHQAWSFYQINDYMASERLASQIFARLRRLIGTSNLEEIDPSRSERVRRLYAISCNYLGLLLAGPMATPPVARGFFNVALSALPDDDRHWLIRAHILANLASAEEDMGHPEDALRHVNDSIALFESTGEPQSWPDYAHLLVRSGRLFGHTGDEAGEEAALRRALDIARAYKPGDNKVLADIQRLVADTFLTWNLTEEAEILLRQARATYERTIGPLARFTADTGIALAQAMWRNGQGGKAVELLRHDVIVSDLHLRNETAMAIEDAPHKTLFTGYHISVAVAMSLDMPELDDLRLTAYEVLLRNRAVTKQLDREKRRLQKRISGGEGEDSSYSQFLALRRDTSRALLSGETEEAVASLHFDTMRLEWLSGFGRRLGTMFTDTMSDADAERARQERELLTSRLASPAASVLKAIAFDEALIEYVIYPYIDRKQGFGGTFRMAAFICKTTMQAPALIDLCNEGQLSDATAEYYEAIESFGEAFEAGAPTSEHGSRMERAGERLRALIFDPLRVYLDDISAIYVSGERLTSVSLCGLPLADGHLIDWYRITYLDSGLDLLTTGASPQQRSVNPPAVFCDPDYDYGLPDEARASGGLQSLPGALHEGRSIAGTLGCEVLSGPAATKNAMLHLRSPLLLHICTHGWYLHRPADQSIPAWSEHPRLKVLSSIPLPTWREQCGLVMAGFNAAWAGLVLDDAYDDGLLTAGEAQYVDCEQTELVTLSACETGLGEEQYHDGVYGLTRAFSIAGAKSVLTSRWKIADEASEVLMAKFYELLIKGETKSDALRRAALHCRETWPQPYFWAAFTLHGDGGPLSADGLAMIPAVRWASQNVRDSRAAAAAILARAAIARGNPLQARDYLSQVQGQPPDAEMSALLGQSCLALGEDSAAVPHLEAAAAAGDSESVLCLGRLLLRRGEPAEAEVWLRKAAESGSNAAGLELIQLLETQGRSFEAAQVQTHLAAAGEPESAYQLGVVAARQGRDAEASRWFTAAASAGSWLAARVLASHFSAHGSDDEAEHWSTIGASLGDGDAAQRLARAAAAQGRPSEALEWLRKAAAAGRADSAYQVALELERIGRPDAAHWLSIAAERQVPGALYIVARRALQTGDHEKATEYLQRAAEKGDLDAIALTGALKASMGDLDSGLKLLDLAASHGNSEAACQLGQLFARLGRPEAAKTLFEKAAKGGVLDGELGLGMLAAAVGDTTGATQHWKGAAAHGSIEAQISLAALYESQGRMDEARQMWEAAAENGSDLAASRLAVLAIAGGREEEGRRLLALGIASGGKNCDEILRLVDTDESIEKSRAERGHVPAMRRLLQLSTLRGDLAAAKQWTLMLADGAEPKSMLEAAMDAQLANHIRQAKDLFGTLTHMGYPDGAVGLARIASSVGDKPEADRNQQVAGRLGTAQEKLSDGLRIAEQEGAEASVPHLREAAELGSPAAAAHLATALFAASREAEEAGNEVDSRTQAEEAAKWAEFSLRGGHSRPAASLGEHYRRFKDDVRSREFFVLADALARGR